MNVYGLLWSGEKYFKTSNGSWPVVTYIFTVLRLLWRVFTFTTWLSRPMWPTWVTLEAGNGILVTLQWLVQSRVVNISETQVIVRAGIKADLWPSHDYWNAKQLAAVRHSAEFSLNICIRKEPLDLTRANSWGRVLSVYQLWRENRRERK